MCWKAAIAVATRVSVEVFPLDGSVPKRLMPLRIPALTVRPGFGVCPIRCLRVDLFGRPGEIHAM